MIRDTILKTVCLAAGVGLVVAVHLLPYFIRSSHK